MDFFEASKIATSWISEISRAKSKDIKFDDDGICSILINEDITIVIEIAKDFPSLYLYGPLVSLPTDDTAASFLLLSRALELNAFQGLTRGGAIAAIPGEGVLIFCQTMPIESGSAELLIKVLSDCANTIEEIQAELSDYKKLSKKIDGDNNPKFQFIKI